MSGKRKDAYKRSKRFIYYLKKLMADVIKGMDAETYSVLSKELAELFDSFAIIDELMDPLECYWEIKISLQKYERFVDKKLFFAEDLKKLLNHFFDVIEDLYFYEIFGFFSTSIHSDQECGLPVTCYCGCVSWWALEPVLDNHGQVVYKKVIRFYNNDKIRPLCMTISSNPEIIEGRNKCKLSDDQIDQIKAFVKKNQYFIKRHYKEKTDSIGFLEEIKNE